MKKKTVKCKWFSHEGCQHMDDDDNPIEGDCPEDFEEQCMWAILAGRDDDYEWFRDLD